MIKRKFFKMTVLIVLTLLIATLSGCRASESSNANVSESENSESGIQESGFSNTDDIMQEESTSGGRTERLDNADGGWSIVEYDEADQEVRRAHYDADGNLKQTEEFEKKGFGTQTTRKVTDYDSSGKEDAVTVYNADGKIASITEYDENGEQKKKTTYIYNADGSLKNTSEYDSETREKREIKYEYDDSGILHYTCEYVGGKQVNYIEYNADGTVYYYSADYEYSPAGNLKKYSTYSADGTLLSESEFNSVGQEIKYTSYAHTYYNNDVQMIGWKVEEYDNNGELINTEYVDLDPAAGQLVNEDLRQQKETEHFVFFCVERDIEVLDVLAEILENNHDRITGDLGKTPSGKTKVYVYPNLKTYHRAIGRPNDPDWSIGEAPGDGCFYLLSPLNPGPEHTYDDILISAVHEYAHVVVDLFNRPQPSYLGEGIACYEAGQDGGHFVERDIAAGTLPSLTEMAGWSSYVDMSDEDAGRAYDYGYVYIEFAVETSGFDTVVSLLEGKSQTEAFGMNMEELNEKWMEFLTSYGNK